MLSQSQAEAAVEVTLTYYAFRRSIGGAFASTIRCSDCCARSGDARAWSALSGMGESALNLAAARLRHVAGAAWSTKRYLNIGLLTDQQMRATITA